MTTDPFHFDLPEDRIALRPVYPRDTARLLVVHGDGRLEDRRVRDLPEYLKENDALVVNNTKVIPAALRAVRPRRDATGQDVDVDLNLLEAAPDGSWWALLRPGKRIRAGDRLEIGEGFAAEVLAKDEGGRVRLSFATSGRDLDACLKANGYMPLPPYIARRRAADGTDREDYQTLFARDEGSVAAPTAGLHFTETLLTRIEAQVGRLLEVTLHVGAGTFAPLTDENLESGRLHSEWRDVPSDVADAINQRRHSGGRVIAVGTTSLRTLESSANVDGRIRAEAGDTDLFIRPGYGFRAVDGLMTNFHLPSSSLFMLVCALMGTDVMQAAYAHAIRQEYRFFSYGDACLLLPLR